MELTYVGKLRAVFLQDRLPFNLWKRREQRLKCFIICLNWAPRVAHTHPQYKATASVIPELPGCFRIEEKLWTVSAAIADFRQNLSHCYPSMQCREHTQARGVVNIFTDTNVRKYDWQRCIKTFSCAFFFRFHCVAPTYTYSEEVVASGVLLPS